MAPPSEFGRDALAIDCAAAADAICAGLREIVHGLLRLRGAVVGLSGGIDSSVVVALCARALGPERVLGVLMPETESSADSVELGRLAAESVGVEAVCEEITPALDAFGCYQRRDAAVRTVIPEYGPGWRMKLVLPSLVGSDRYRLFSVVGEAPDGRRVEARLTATAYREVVAATSFKQRVRKTIEYYHADRLGFAVAGTPNRLEYDQGFFVKNGDGAADVKPIAHLYKTQVYRLAEHLELPEAIRSRPPTTDTYSLEQSQEEFYFAVPYDTLDLCLYAHNAGLPAAAVAPAAGLSEEDVERVYRDIEQKRRTTRPLHLGPQLVEPVPEIDAD
ncbi:MAG: NAD(+) synthase [Thermoleophilia bacterium]|nr:NAD(+) synthase [Thermoleophilia bacterium]